MKLRNLTVADVTFTFNLLPEIEDPKHMFDGSENPEEVISWINAELDKGNSWAWFTAEVTATWGNWSNSELLGCCSYESEKDWLSDNYLEMLQKDALAGLNGLIRGDAEMLEKLRYED